ncbi:N-acetylmuramoyl-L-alanine amidase, partial [candidate division KSB1 bacterium]|nr:N-acetylmuramoyl-L-alanine amidase [candidate division KSB1 bacterium]
MRFARHCVSIFFLGWLQLPLIAQPTVKVIYPQNGQQILATDSTFVFGMVLPATAKFTINSKPVTLYPNGAFLSMLPLTPKETRLDCRAEWENNTTQQLLTVLTPDYLVTSAVESLVIDTTFIFPANELQLQTGDLFRVVLKGTPGAAASFSIAGLVPNIPMVEVVAEKRQFWGDAVKGGAKPVKGRGVQGVYTGLYEIGAGDEIDHTPIYFKLVRNALDSLIFRAPGTLTIQNTAPPRLMQLPATFYEPQIKPGFNAMVFLPEKLKIAVTAQDNFYYRLELANNEFFWLRSDSLPLLPCKPGNEIPTIGATTIKNEDSHTLISVQLNAPVPIRIETFSNPVRFVLTFWGVQTNRNRILDLQLIPHVRKAEWFTQSTLQQLVIELDQKQLLGYRPAYETNQFILELKNPPEAIEWPGSPLKNIIVALDPGHNPDLGAVGPTGLIEKDVNLEVCHRLKRHLEEKEAMVVLTRDEEQGVAL